MKKIGFAVLSFFIFCHCAFGSIDDTIIVIKEVKATGVRFNTYSTGARIDQIDSAFTLFDKTSNIAELLSRYSLINVRSYGPSGLSSISMRGGTSRHVAVIWNGFNLKSPMSGGMNFSTMPAGFIDNVTIQSGGSATMYGSGASTGVIFLSNNLYTGKNSIKFNSSLEAASFNTKGGSFGVSRVGPRFSTRLKMGILTSENNFDYVSQTFGRPKVELEHAAFKRYAVSQQNTWATGKKSKLESDIWYTYLFKEIPSLMTDEDPGSAEQTDKNFRGSLVYSYYRQHFTLKARSGVFSDQVYYCDKAPLQEIENNNRSFSAINEIENKYSFSGNQIINIGFNQTFEHASSGGYVSDTGRNRISVYGRYNLLLFDQKLNFSLETRQEFLKGANIPFVFSVGGQYEFGSNVFLKANISKHYTLPVFDDLFWAEDAFAKGNPDLRPEYGWNYESGIKKIWTNTSLTFENELTVYQNRINDLIIWMPGSNNGKYTPTNFKYSVTTGAEYTANLKKELNTETRVVLGYSFAFTDAHVYTDESAHTGQKRIYVPKYKTNAHVNLIYKRWQLMYSQSFESKRYYDDISTLDPYILSDVQAAYDWQIAHKEINFYLKVKNLFNTEYQIQNGYAQPLRNYAIGMNITL
jgi:vitamin B12 transporter